MSLDHPAIDYEVLARDTLDVTPTPDDRAALRVWADQLEAAGDPRGALIALEHAEHAEPHRRHELRRAGYAHAVAHADALLGPIAEAARGPRTLELEWRAGHLYGLALDVRDLTEPYAIAALVQRVRAAPAAVELRRLQLRVRTSHQDPVLVAGLSHQGPSPLEELVMFSGGAPLRRLGDRMYLQGRSLRHMHPALRLLAVGGFIAWPLEDRAAAAYEFDARRADPESPHGRALIGRALTHPEPGPREAALDRIMDVGPRAAALTETLVVLLRAENVAPKLRIALALAKIGDAARAAIPGLAAITGRPAYDAQTRRAAGVALARLR